MSKSFRDLEAWKRSMNLAVDVYEQTEGFPREEVYGLTAQMRKAAASVPSNIAEGQGRLTNREWRRFLGIARGSLQELETQVLLAERLGFLCGEGFCKLSAHLENVGRLLNGLIAYVASRVDVRKHRT